MKERLAALLARLPTVPLPKGRPSLELAGYAAFFVLVFCVSAYLTFPYDRLRDYLVQEVERPMGPGGVRVPSGWELDVVSLEPSWLTGVRAAGVRLARAPEGPESPPMELQIDELRARVSVLALLGGGLGLRFGARLAGGELEGSYRQSDETRSLELALETIELRRLGLLRAYVPVPIRGALSGDIDVALAADPTASAGKVELEVAGLAVGDGQAKLPLPGVPGMSEGVTLERIDAGDFHFAAKLAEGVADVERLTAEGPDVELAGDGTVRLGEALNRSRLELLVRVRFTDAYRSRNDRTRAIFDILDLSPVARRARTDDGALQYQISGLLGATVRGTPAGRLPPPG